MLRGPAAAAAWRLAAARRAAASVPGVGGAPRHPTSVPVTPPPPATGPAAAVTRDGTPPGLGVASPRPTSVPAAAPDSGGGRDGGGGGAGASPHGASSTDHTGPSGTAAPPPPRPHFPSAPKDTPSLTPNRGRKATLDRMLRVDHAGELGARRIYAGQLAVLGGHPTAGPLLREMAAQEAVHLAAFDDLLPRRRVRPTALTPVWAAAGYALGVGTALLGVRGAMACTVAVETVIAGHYNDQVRTLLGEGFEDEAPLRATLRQFRDEELEHKETGLANEAEQAVAYRALSKVIEGGCRAAIYLSERV